MDEYFAMLVGFIIGVLLGAGVAVACFEDDLRTFERIKGRVEALDIQKPIKVNVTMIDSGVEVLKFDNATLLPNKGMGISYTHMGTEYALTGIVLIEEAR